MTGRSDATDVWVWSERHELALELLAVGRRLADQRGGRLTAVAFDPWRAAECRAHGADRAVAFELAAGAGAGAAPDVALAALASVVAAEPVGILLVGATAHGTEVAARLAQRLRVACATECLALDAAAGALVVERRCLGRFIARQRLAGTPAVATVPPRRFEPPGRAAAPPGGFPVELRPLEPPPLRTRVVASRERASSRVPVVEAAAVVAAGRGLRRAEDLGMVRDLADALGGALAATRPLTDDFQWLPVDVKVGLSGQTVAPELYIACGVSGQIEHVVGMRESRLVVAVNADADAPMMREADLCLVGDLYDLVPALTRALRRRRDNVEAGGAPPPPPSGASRTAPCPTGSSGSPVQRPLGSSRLVFATQLK